MASYLIWDFDDTLGYREPGKWTASLVRVLEMERPDFPVEVEAIRPHMQAGFPWHTPEAPHPKARSAEAYWQSLYPLFAKAFRGAGLSSSEADRLARKVRQVYTDPSAWRLFEDSQPTLKRLTELGWRHCLLTNHVPELPLILSHLGVLEEFAVVVNSADTGYEKPHPQAFRRVLEALTEPRAVWMIGDSYEADIAGAEAVGVPGILVRKAHQKARRYCSDLSGVIPILPEATP